MWSVTIRNLPDEVHKAIRTRAVQHGHSMQDELYDILVHAVNPAARPKLGDLLESIGQKVKLTDEELAAFESDHSAAPATTFAP